MSKFNSVITNKKIVFVCKVLLAIIFGYAGLSKIVDPVGFSDSIYAYRILPLFAINPIAIVLPWIELLCALSLLVRCIAPAGASILAVLNFIFTIAVFSALVRGLDISCGCFSSSSDDAIGIYNLIRNMFFIFLCLPIILSALFNSDYQNSSSESSLSENIS